MDVLIGQQLGKYQLQAEIGHGGMGIVYRGYDPALRRPVAIKVLPPQLTYDAQFVRRFRQEAVLAASLRHPGIVTIHDVGEQGGVYYIVMEYLEGMTLEAWLARQGPLTPGQAARIVRQLADALDYAHSRGVVHRDIKPANVMISPEERVTLMDFGLVRAAEGTSLTRSGVVMGTPEYMSPEQALGEPVDGRSDVYSLGILLYKMLSGKVPFSRSTPYAITYAHIHEPPPPLRQVRRDLPAALEAVVDRALAKRPEQRYARAGLLADDLEAVAAGKMPGAARAVAAASVARDGESTRLLEKNARRGAAGGAWIHNKPWVWPTGAAVLLLVIVAAALALTRDEHVSDIAVATEPPETETTREPAATTSPMRRESPVAIDLTRASKNKATDVHSGLPTDTRTPSAEVTTSPRSVSTGTPLIPSVTPTSPPPVAVISADIGRLRSGPGTNYDVVGKSSQGDQYPITARNSEGSWFQVLVGDAPAWISAGIVSVLGDISAVPVASSIPPSPTPRSAVCELDTDRSFVRFLDSLSSKQRTGCPTDLGFATEAALGPFEHGSMIWRRDIAQIYVIFDDGFWWSFDDTWVDGDPVYLCPDIAPSQSPPTPVRGFGRIWCQEPGVRQRLGFVTEVEWGENMKIQTFERGTMMATSRGIYALFADGSWIRQ